MFMFCTDGACRARRGSERLRVLASTQGDHEEGPGGGVPVSDAPVSALRPHRHLHHLSA